MTDSRTLARTKTLTDAPIDSDIVERHYQHRAIRDRRQFRRQPREALLVMATGSGKTRTVVARVKQLMEANLAKRVLFLADPHCINYPGHQHL